jgi:hypothetical protein
VKPDGMKASADHEEVPMGTTTGDGLRPDSHERARDGVEHLRAAAHELIAAARAMLDVAEELVDDPDTAAALVGTLANVGTIARRVTGSGGWPAPARRDAPPDGGADLGDDGDPAGDEPRVQRIAVS